MALIKGQCGYINDLINNIANQRVQFAAKVVSPGWTLATITSQRKQSILQNLNDRQQGAIADN